MVARVIWDDAERFESDIFYHTHVFSHTFFPHRDKAERRLTVGQTTHIGVWCNGNIAVSKTVRYKFKSFCPCQMAPQFSWLKHQSVTLESAGSIPAGVAKHIPPQLSRQSTRLLTELSLVQVQQGEPKPSRPMPKIVSRPRLVQMKKLKSLLLKSLTDRVGHYELDLVLMVEIECLVNNRYDLMLLCKACFYE